MLVPAKTAERLFVALSVVVQELERKTDYPTDSLHVIVGDFDRERNTYLGGKGWLPSQIKVLTDTATQELLLWLEERAEKSEEARKHLAEWEREFE